MTCKSDHLCNCGTSTHTPHKVGKGGCTRRMTEAPTHQPDKKNTHEEWVIGKSNCSDYTLRQQRGYRQHACGCWSRAGESTNSLPDNFG